jgi:hypothetical protein
MTKQSHSVNRPREKLKVKDSQASSLSELFTIVTGSGGYGECAVEFLKHILYYKKRTFGLSKPNKI